MSVSARIYSVRYWLLFLALAIGLPVACGAPTGDNMDLSTPHDLVHQQASDALTKS